MMLQKRFKDLVNSIRQPIVANSRSAARIEKLLVHQEIERIKSNPRYSESKSLIPYGYKIYSQNEEDGMIREIFSRIGTTNKIFVEFGIGNGLENNTAALLFEDWKGLWIEASEEHVATIKNNLNAIINRGKLKVVESFITKENINELISSNIDDSEIDLLSVDIDGNDYHVLNAITCVKPRVIVVEYNAKFVPPVSYCMDYDDSHIWKANDCQGVSLKFLEERMEEYCLVGCDFNGVNAFFVRKDLVQDQFLEPYTAEKHFEPARYHLSSFSSGHPPSYETLNKSLTMRDE